MPLHRPTCLFSHSLIQTRGILHRAHSNFHNKPYFITTPIFYPNAAPHVGHLYSLVIGDIYARHAHLTRDENATILLSGADEHGLKIQKAAKEEGLQPQNFVEIRSRPFRDLAEAAHVDLAYFVRTSSKPHHEAVRHLWTELDARGHIYKGKHAGWYSVSDECFYTDNQVIAGHDPKTGERAKVSKETGNVVAHAEEENYMFRLSAFRDRLRERYEENPNAIYPPQQYQDVMGILSSPDGLQDLSISRPASRLWWGVKVPDDAMQTIYVWVDALTSYLSGIGYPWADASRLGEGVAWPPDVQVIGKDILRFHAIYFPAFLMALDLPLPRTLLSHSHWTVNKTKMSKSLGNVVDPMKEMEGYGVDTIRWYLARVGGRFKDDVDWSTEQLEKHESEASSLLGNFLLRIQSRPLIQRLPAGYQHIPLEHSTLLPADGTRRPGDGVKDRLLTLRERVDESLKKFELAEALEAIVECLNLANKEFTDTAPWASSTPISTAITVQIWSRETLRICGLLLQPFIPSKAAELLDALCVSPQERTWEYAEVGRGAMRSGPLKRTILFPNKEQRKRLSVEKDHETEEKGEVDSPDRTKRKVYWDKVHNTSRLRHANDLYLPPNKQEKPVHGSKRRLRNIAAAMKHRQEMAELLKRMRALTRTSRPSWDPLS